MFKKNLSEILQEISKAIIAHFSTNTLFFASIITFITSQHKNIIQAYYTFTNLSLWKCAMNYGDTLLIISFVLMWLYILIQRKDPKNQIILGNLLIKGQSLCNEEIHWEEYAKWQKELESWINKTESQLSRNKNKSYVIIFNNLTNLSYDKSVGYYCNVEHGRDKRKLLSYLKNLEKIINIIIN